MSYEKINEILDRYEDLLGNLQDANTPNKPEVVHMLSMIPKMREFNKHARREKLMRWLGFLQGALWSLGVYSIEELKSHNMPDGP